jgi:hypothetical protein
MAKPHKSLVRKPRKSVRKSPLKKSRKSVHKPLVKKSLKSPIKKQRKSSVKKSYKSKMTKIRRVYKLNTFGCDWAEDVLNGIQDGLKMENEEYFNRCIDDVIQTKILNLFINNSGQKITIRYKSYNTRMSTTNNLLNITFNQHTIFIIGGKSASWLLDHFVYQNQEETERVSTGQKTAQNIINTLGGHVVLSKDGEETSVSIIFTDGGNSVKSSIVIIILILLYQDQYEHEHDKKLVKLGDLIFNFIQTDIPKEFVLRFENNKWNDTQAFVVNYFNE